MAQLSLIAFVLFSLVTSSKAQIYLPREYCQNTTPVKGFSETKFMGTWYEVASTPNLIESQGMDVTFKLTKPKNSIEVVLSMKQSSEKTQLQGKMIPLIENNINGQYSLTFDKITESSSAANVDNFSADIIILDTDYKTYASVWSCEVENFAGANITKHMAWIFARKRELDDQTFAKASSALSDVYVLPYQLKYTIQHSGSAKHLISILCTTFSIIMLGVVS